MNNDEKDLKIRDILAIDFGDELLEIVSSLEVALVLLSAEDDVRVITACRNKLVEGVGVLKVKILEKQAE